MTSGLLFLKTFGALAVVLGLFFIIIYALKRWGGSFYRKPTSQTMEVLARQSFGPRHHLIMVKVSGERSVLVGVSPQNMSLLCLSETSVPGGELCKDAGENI